MIWLYDPNASEKCSRLLIEAIKMLAHDTIGWAPESGWPGRKFAGFWHISCHIWTLPLFPCRQKCKLQKSFTGNRHTSCKSTHKKWITIQWSGGQYLNGIDDKWVIRRDGSASQNNNTRQTPIFVYFRWCPKKHTHTVISVRYNV